MAAAAFSHEKRSSKNQKGATTTQSETMGRRRKLIDKINNVICFCKINVLLENIQNIVAIIIPIAGFWALFWQIDKQHKNNIKAQNDVLANKAKKELFDTISIEIDKLEKISTKHQGDCNRIVKPFLDGNKISYQSDDQLIHNFHENHNQIIDQMLIIGGLLEKYEFIEPKLSIYRKFISVFQYDYFNTYQKSIDIVYKYLNTTLDFESGKKANQELETYKSQVFKTYDLIFDLRVELQNLCFNNIFGNKIPLRKPINPEVKVLSTENYDSLVEYFEQETDWGKFSREIEKEQKNKYKDS